MSQTITKTAKVVKTEVNITTAICDVERIPYLYMTIRLNSKGKKQPSLPSGFQKYTYEQAMAYNAEKGAIASYNRVCILLRESRYMVVDFDDAENLEERFSKFGGNNYVSKSCSKGLPHLWRLKDADDWSKNATKINNEEVDFIYSYIFERRDAKMICYDATGDNMPSFDYKTHHPTPINKSTLSEKTTYVRQPPVFNEATQPHLLRLTAHLQNHAPEDVASYNIWFNVGNAIKSSFPENDWFSILRCYSAFSSSPEHNPDYVDYDVWAAMFDDEPKCGIPTILEYSKKNNETEYERIETEYREIERKKLMEEGKQKLMESVAEDASTNKTKKEQKKADMEILRAEILADKNNKIADNDLEASEIIYAEIKDNIKFSNKILYYKHNYQWVSDYSIIKSLLGNYIRQSGIRRINSKTGNLEDYAQLRNCGQNILNDVIDIATVHCDNMWSNEMFKSSLGKILFKNGYYNFHLGKFFKHADTDYDHSIIFIELIPYNFIPPTDEEMEYIYSIKRRLFIDPFGEDVAEYYLLNIARGLAGDAMKRALFGIGDGNTGKSIMTSSIEGACGGYFGTFNANNITVKRMPSSGDDAQQMRWIMMLLSKRIVASNELEPDVVINGTILKKISSGGLDKIVARMHGGNETEFVISFLSILFANDLDKIKPMDDAIVERIRAIPHTKKYVNEPSNNFELKKDGNLTNEIGTLKFKTGFMYLLMDSYKNFVDNNRIEIEPAAIGKAIISTFGGIDDFITILKEDYEITDNPDDYVVSADLIEWIKQRKLGISITKLGRDLNKYAELNKLANLHSHTKKISGKLKQVWIGIKQIIEGEDYE